MLGRYLVTNFHIINRRSSYMLNTTTAARNFAQQFGYDPEDKSEKELQAKRREFVEWKETVWKKHLIEFYQQDPRQRYTTRNESKLVEAYKTIFSADWIIHFKYIWQYWLKNWEIFRLSFKVHDVPYIKNTFFRENKQFSVFTEYRLQSKLLWRENWEFICSLCKEMLIRLRLRKKDDQNK